MTHRKTLMWCLACLLTGQVGAHLLDAVGLVEGLLAPNGARLLLLVPLSVVFYGARLASYFVVPGVLLAVAGAVIVANLRVWREKRAQDAMQGVEVVVRDRLQQANGVDP